MKAKVIGLILTGLYASSSFGWTLTRVEGILGVKNETTLHRRCTLSDKGILIEKNIGSWATASQRNLTRHFVSTAKALSQEVQAVDANLESLPAGTPVVNYWVANDGQHGFIFRSEQFPVGSSSKQVRYDGHANEVLADFLDIACNAD